MQMHWSAASRQPAPHLSAVVSSATSSFDRPAQPPMQGRSPDMTGLVDDDARHHLGPPTTAAVGGTNPPTPIPSTPHNNNNNNATTTQTSTNTNTSIPQANTSRRVPPKQSHHHPPPPAMAPRVVQPSSGSCTQSSAGHSAFYHTDGGAGMNQRDAPPALAGAQHQRNAGAGTYFSGTRTTFTDVPTASMYSYSTSGGGTGGGGGANNNTAPVSGLGVDDFSDEEINQLLHELECSVGSPYAQEVLRDAAAAIEERATLNFDPLARDVFLEQRIRSVLNELIRVRSTASLQLACQLIDAVLDIPYTSAPHKFTRLCRSLTVVLQSGQMEVAMEAQRVYKRMLDVDRHFHAPEPPLKLFIAKELKDTCELALLQLHGRIQQVNAPFTAQYLSIMLLSASTAEVSPRYMSMHLRGQVVQLATILVGSDDAELRRAAYDCLVAIFSSTHHLQHNEIVMENRRVWDECLRTLNTSQSSEAGLVSSLKVLRALLSSRGLQCIDKQVLPPLCILVTEQQRVSRSSAIREAVFDLVPIIASFDIASAPRRLTYVAIIMEPVKNVRAEQSKREELLNVAAFIRSVGYSALDPTNRINLDSILHRYISRPETQEACWCILAAMCESIAKQRNTSGALLTSPKPTRPRHGSSGSTLDNIPITTSTDLNRSDATASVKAASNNSVEGDDDAASRSPTSSRSSHALLGSGSPHRSSTSAFLAGGSQTSVEDVVRRCLPHLTSAALTSQLVKHLAIIQQCVAPLKDEVQQALEQLVNIAMKEPDGRTNVNPTRTTATGPPRAADTHGLVMPDARSDDRERTSSSTTGMMAPSPSVSVDGSSARLTQLYKPVDGNPIGTAPNNNNATRAYSPTTPSNPSGSGSATLHYSPSSMEEHHFPVSDLTVALEVFSRRPVNSLQQLEELKNAVVPFMRHSEVAVRKQCSATIMTCLTQWIRYAMEHRTSTYSTRVTEILEAFVKHALAEQDPSCRLECITLLATTASIRSFLLEQRILSPLLSFLNGAPKIRERTVELLVAITQDPSPTATVVSVQQSLTITIESCVTVLEYAVDVRSLIRCVADLQTFTQLCVRPLGSHLGRIFLAFQKKLRDPSVADVVSLAILKTLERILTALAKDERSMLSHHDDVVDIYGAVVAILRDSSSPSLRHAAIDVLVCAHRLYSYPSDRSAEQHQELIAAVTSVYTGTTYTRLELFNMLSLFGQLGAIDPTIQSSSNNLSAAKKAAEDATAQAEADLEMAHDYTVIVYRTLCRMLDVTLSDAVCLEALRALLQFMHFCGEKRSLVGGVHAVRAVVKVAKRTAESPSLRIEALRILSAIITMRHERVARVVLPEIVVLLEQLWIPTDLALFRALLEVVAALKPGKLSAKEQSESWAWLYPRLMDVALQDRTETNEFCLRVVEIILSASYIPPHCVPLVLPMLIQFVQKSEQLIEVRSQSLCAAIHIVCELNAGQYFPLLMHGIRTLTRHCELKEDLGPRLATPGVRESLKLLASLYPGGRIMIKALRDRFMEPEVMPLSAATSPSAILGAFRSSRAGTTGRASVPSTYRTNSYSGAEDEEDGLSSHPPQHMEGTSYDLSVFIKHIDWGLRLKESKLREWFGELQKCIILASPSPAFRMTIDLFDKHEPLRRELFHPSFKSLYEVLPVEQIRKVNEVLANVLASNDSELVSRCLGLSDYLDHNPPNFQPGVVEELTAMKRSDPMLGISNNNNNSSVDSGQYRGVLTSHALRSLSGSDGFDILRRSREIKGSASISTTATGAMVVPAGSAEEAHNALTFQDSLDNEEGARGGGGGGGGIRPRAGPHTTLVPGRLRPPHQPHSSSGDASAKGGPYEARSEGEAARLASHIPLTPHVLFSSELITKAAERTHMYDKAVSTLENTLLMLLRTCRTGTISKEAIRKIVWPLARLYSKREMQDSVVGLFQAIRYKGESNDGFGFELLQWWEEAQKAYSRSVMHADAHFSTASSGLLEGYIRTLVFCGEFSRATEVAKRVCYLNAEKATSSIARCGAMAAWVLGSWEDVSRLAECIGTVEQHSFPQRLFFSTGMHLRSAIRDKSAAISDSLKISLTQAKLAVDDSLRTLLPLSYAHAYENLTMLQHFTEMEELLEYTHCHSETLKHKMRESWNFRFMSLKPDAFEPSMRSLLLHSLVLTTQEMSDMILHFCDSMGSNYPRVTHWAMEWLKQGVVPPQVMAQSPTAAHAAAAASTTGAAAASSSSSPTTTSATSSPSSIHCASITVGFFAHIWNQGRRQEAVAEMERFLEQCGAELETSQVTCYGSAQLKLGTWKQELHADSFWKKELREEALSHFHKAIRSVPSSYEAWHSWGLINYRVQQRDRTLSLEEQRSFVEAAHQGFVAAICRCKDSSEALPGVMRLLQLWVIHNGVSLLKETVADSISRIPVDHWVQAIPQLIGHLGSENHDVREVIGMILISICSVHPQAVVFPLLVVYMDEADGVGSSDALQRRKRELAQAIVTHCPKRIRHEAETVANLLMEVSAIPIERIREHLSQVAAAWNPNAEFEEDKEEVHRRLKAAMELFNNNRRHFIFTVGNIGDCVKMVMEDERRGNHAQAVRIVNQLVDEISKHIAKNLGREPQKAMEPLLRLRNLSVAVFGKYDIHSQEPFPTIASFSSKLDVIPSKKRPRRIQLNGSDGCLYSFCLKGNEDIRMDERVMQLFGMVNVLLSHSRGSSAAAYIHRFPVIPISPNMGLLGWVENASTINSTICYYRSTISKVSAHHESQVLTTYLNTTAHWEKLSLVQRTEVLEYVMGCANCEAVDVSRAMWHRANTAEQWLASRTAFTTSLASMSMVGYVMGLGDRHLGNLLLSTSTGKIIHIDFGDSFDVGRLRHVLPETIPFRLTRMLTNAMEVFGVDGVFRASATRTQTLLHRNRDSIMALLSAFVHDPIVQHKGKMKNMMEKSRSPQDVVERIRNKLRGTEIAVSDTNFAVFNTTRESCRRPDLLYMSKAFDDDAQREQSLAMSPAAQVHYLIEEATRVENYSTMYFGWGPLW